MNWNNIVGPATFVYLLSITVGGVWWASDLSARMMTQERVQREAADTAGRLVRLETLVGRIDDQLGRIERKLDDRR
ncbi:MAG: hypothetical protein E6Q97_10900 [Desulfurellales bacterium]|nr:MAG: hypothetical protein E6Q97_10900 [Desulfurellales bacterium]